MKPQFVFSVLRVGTNVLFILLSLSTIAVIVFCLLTFAGVRIDRSVRTFAHDVIATDKKYKKPAPLYSPDRLVRYYGMPERYKVEVELKTRLGNFSFYNTVLNMGIGIVILWLFRKIFSEINLKNSFQMNIYRRLVQLAIIFVLSDVINFVNYFIFNSLLKKSVAVPDFELIMDVGNKLVTGLIIYAIAIIYQCGLRIQEENELTV